MWVIASRRIMVRYLLPSGITATQSAVDMSVTSGPTSNPRRSPVSSPDSPEQR